MEKIPSALAAEVSKKLTIPTIGIGSGPHCDGQIVVNYDMLGMITSFKPRFVRQYMQGADLVKDAVSRWVNDVREGTFPNAGESYEVDAKAEKKS